MPNILCKAVEYPSETVLDLDELPTAGLEHVKFHAKQLIEEIDGRLGEAVPPARQRTMFSGLDCLPGQQDLFPTDGEPS